MDKKDIELLEYSHFETQLKIYRTQVQELISKINLVNHLYTELRITFNIVGLNLSPEFRKYEMTRILKDRDMLLKMQELLK